MAADRQDPNAWRDLSGCLPWTKSCFVCGESNPHGLRVKSRLENGKVIIDYTTRETDLGYKHIVHGGLAMTLLDEVMTWAAICAAGRVCVAADFSARLLRPIRLDQTIRVEGWLARDAKRILFTEGQILDADGQIYLTATGKYMPMPVEQIELTEKDFVHSSEALDPASIVRKTQ